MVEKIVLAESNGIDFDINGHIYNVNFDDKKSLIKFQRVRKEFLDWQAKHNQIEWEEKDIEESVVLLKKVINTILGEENAVNNILSEKQRDNIRILTDLALQLFEKTKQSQENFVKERISSEYAPE